MWYILDMATLNDQKKPGRPAIGPETMTESIGLVVTPTMLAELDRARAGQSRAAYIRDAIAMAVGRAEQDRITEIRETVAEVFAEPLPEHLRLE